LSEERDFVAFDDAESGGLRAGGAEGEDGSLGGGVGEEVPVGGVEGLPDAVDLGLAVGGAGLYADHIITQRGRVGM